MLPSRLSTAGPTVRGLMSQAFFSTRDTEMVELIDGETSFNDVVVRCGGFLGPTQPLLLPRPAVKRPAARRPLPAPPAPHPLRGYRLPPSRLCLQHSRCLLRVVVTLTWCGRGGLRGLGAPRGCSVGRRGSGGMVGSPAARFHPSAHVAVRAVPRLCFTSSTDRTEERSVLHGWLVW
jgi:hypothetical protein